MKAYYYPLSENGSKIDSEEVEKMYDASSYKLGKPTEKDRPKEGDRKEDTVKEVVEGTREKLMRNFKKFQEHVPEASPDEPCIKVVCETGADLVITLPKTAEAHPKSKMGAWLRTYRRAPHVGQKVDVMADENGYYRIVLLA